MIEYEIQHLFIPLEWNIEISECRMIFSMVAHHIAHNPLSVHTENSVRLFTYSIHASLHSRYRWLFIIIQFNFNFQIDGDASEEKTKINPFKNTPPTLSTMDKLLAVADSENTLSCDCDKVSRLNSLKRNRRKNERKNIKLIWKTLRERQREKYS